jgi:transposase
MVYVGLDVHKGYSRVGLYNPVTGELVDLGKVSHEPEQVAGLLAELPTPKTVVLEAGRSSDYMAALLEPLAEEVWVVDPVAVRKLQERAAKTDRRDAAALAYWAAKGAIEPLWRPDAVLLDLRELTRGKTSITRLAVQVRCLMRSLLARHGYECPYRDLLGLKGQAWVDRVHLPTRAGQQLADLREVLVVLQGKADTMEQKVAQAAEAYEPARRLMTIPGVGPFLGLSLAVEIGDARRFPTPGHLRGYSGLVPRVHQSGDKDSRGRLTKRGNRWLRYAAVLAAQRMAAMRHADPRLKRTFLSVAFRHGHNPGKVACARRLLDLVHHLLCRHEDYRPRPPRRANVDGGTLQSAAARR